MKKLIFFLFTIFLLLSFNFQAFAQPSDGSADGTTPPAGDPTLPPADPTAGGTSSTPTPTSASTGTVTPPPTPKPPIPTIAPPPTTPPIVPITEGDNPITPPTPNSNNSVLLIALGALALGVLSLLGFFGLRAQKKKTKDKEDDKKCANIKKLMEDKLSNLTDLKGQLAGMAKSEASKQIKNAVKGTMVEDLLILIENGKKEYERLKGLYEKCIMDFSLSKTTLLFLHKPQEKQILLAMKKRGFGEGKWNAVGGKLNEGETIKEALIREAKEEIGVKVNPDDLVQMATLDFSFKDNLKWNQQSHVFFTEKWEGEPVETEEMSPRWHSVGTLPYDKMWVDDTHWLPLVLSGKKVEASFTFNKTGDEILDKKIKHIDDNN